MKIKSRVWYWLSAASSIASLLYDMGLEGSAQTGRTISDSQFATALCLVLAAVLFLRLGFAAQDREERLARKAHKPLTDTVKPDRRMGA